MALIWAEEIEVHTPDGVDGSFRHDAHSDEPSNEKREGLGAEAAIAIPDEALRERVAETLGIPVTTWWDGSRQPARPLHAADLATLTSLDAAYLGVRSLEGLQFATNLRALNLSGNHIAGLL